MNLLLSLLFAALDLLPSAPSGITTLPDLPDFGQSVTNDAERSWRLNAVPLPATNTTPLMSLPTIEALRSAIPTAPVALVAEYYPSSGPFAGRGGGTFLWRANSTRADDGG